MTAAERRVGPYVLLAELGRGGAGVVHRARRDGDELDVALKLVPVARGEDRSRVLREADRHRGFRHPSVVPLLDAGETPEGCYLVTALVDGGTLADRIAAGPLDPVGVVGLLRPIAAALDAAHARGLVHRDVTPANVLIDDEGRALLADFGASHAGDGATVSGGYAGTVAYSSPEQLRAEPPAPAADVYALAAVAYACLTGTPPFGASTPASVVYGHLHRNPVPADVLRPELGPAVGAAVGHGLAKQPGDRPGTCGRLVDELAGALPPGVAGGLAGRPARGAANAWSAAGADGPAASDPGAPVGAVGRSGPGAPVGAIRRRAARRGVRRAALLAATLSLVGGAAALGVVTRPDTATPRADGRVAAVERRLDAADAALLRARSPQARVVALREAAATYDALAAVDGTSPARAATARRAARAHRRLVEAVRAGDPDDARRARSAAQAARRALAGG